MANDGRPDGGNQANAPVEVVESTLGEAAWQPR
jgi:hypothetical protein